jgi:hypothetical protein
MSRRAVAFSFVWLALSVVRAVGQGVGIDPNRLYVTPLNWHNAPRGIHEQAARAQLLVLFADGQFAELDSTMMRRDRKSLITFSAGDGNHVRLGTWTRTDDDVIRIVSREEFRDPETVPRMVCQPPTSGSGCTKVEEPLPGFETVEMCGMRGHPRDAVADALDCGTRSLSRLKFAIDLAYVEEMIHAARQMQAVHATAGH